MKLKIDGVRKPLKFVKPRLHPAVLALVRALVPLYFKVVLGLKLRPVQPEEIAGMAEEYRAFFSGESRLILVFRHVHVHDAQVIYYLINHILPRSVRLRRQGRFRKRPHAHFLYGRGVPVWGGRWMEWLFSRAGGIPVFHRKLDREGLDTVRSYVKNGTYPIALAPEGQVTYHNEVVHPIEPGFAQIALWGRADMQAEGRGTDMRILPISQYYTYAKDEREGAKLLQDLLGKLRVEAGLSTLGCEGSPESTVQRLRAAGAELLTSFENFYRELYGLEHFSDPGDGIMADECSRRRVERLVNGILEMLEEKYGILHPPAGVTPRIFVVRQAGWNRIFREKPDIFSRNPAGMAGGGKTEATPGSTKEEVQKVLSPLEKSLSDFLAVEAGLFGRHLELVDLMAYLQPEHALESSDINRQIEFALNLLDAASRMEGGTIGQRYHPSSCEVSVRIGEAVSLNQMLDFSPDKSLRQLREDIVEEVTRQFEELSSRNPDR